MISLARIEDGVGGGGCKQTERERDHDHRQQRLADAQGERETESICLLCSRAEECLSPQAAQCETRGQLQLTVK